MATAVAIGISALALALQAYSEFKPEAAPPPEPTAVEIITPYLPQVLLIIVVLGCVWMIAGILKYYKKSVIIFLFPILISILYIVLVVFFFIILASNNLLVVAFAIDFVLTLFYLFTSFKIYKGKKQTKKIFVAK